MNQHAPPFKGKCKESCVEACKTGAIDFDPKEEVIDRKVGSIIMTTGYDTFDPHRHALVGYAIYEKVITEPQFDWLSTPSGPARREILPGDSLVQIRF